RRRPAAALRHRAAVAAAVVLAGRTRAGVAQVAGRAATRAGRPILAVRSAPVRGTEASGARHAEREVGRLTRGRLTFDARQRRANERTMHRTVFFGVG